VSEYRLVDAVPFFERLLRDSDPDVWKASLDALVAAGGTAAARALSLARKAAPAQQRPWIDEALEQLNAAGR
jgi:hypothetical protein